MGFAATPKHPFQSILLRIIQGADGLAFEQLSVANDDHKRCFQLVRHDAQKFVLDLARFLQLVAGGLQALEELFGMNS